ncbi:MAG: MBL fold metallo-hydrolase [Chloroflexota bacterium]
MSRTKLILLGTGTPGLAPNTAQSSSVVIVDETPYVVDCGSGMLQRMAQARVNHPVALAAQKLTKLFITHLHPDHTLGLPDFIIAEWVKLRRDTVHIYGPAGIAKMAHGVLDLYELGIAEHQFRGPAEFAPIDLDVTEYTDGIIYQDDLVEVEAFRVDHGQLETYALKFVTPDKTIVFSADTCPVPIMVEKAKDCDILVHEVFYEAGMETVPEMWRAYMHRTHTSGRALGRIAKEAHPGLLVTNHHILYGGNQPEDLIAEIRSGGFEGEVVFGQDLAEFE